ncbi:hypothetical protein GTW29_13400 [Streptomyces sp. SID7834]|nr:hypothetical protein [Streptomyces sp. SID7834]MYT57697.1 hypothetical protein [Streptomyces sp. SID7834]
MTYGEVQPDTRVTIDSRRGITATVLMKRPDGFGADRPVVRLVIDNGTECYNYPEQLTPLDQPAPSPKLRGSRGTAVSSFWFRGDEYEVWNTTGVGSVRGHWACTRRVPYGTPATEADHVVRNAATRKAAFDTAVGTLRSAANIG